MTEWQNFRIPKRRDFMKRRWAFIWMGRLVLLLVVGIQTQAVSAQIHQVKMGDTLIKIAKKYGVSVESIKKANHLQTTNLQIKQRLVIPSSKAKSGEEEKLVASTAGKNKTPEYYTVRKGDTLYGIAKKTGVSVTSLKAMNQLKGTSLRIGRRLVIARPVTGEQRTPRQNLRAATDSASQDIESLEEDLSFITEQEWEEIEREQGESGEFLGKWRSLKERQLLVKVALGFIGAPYRSGGDTVRGLDSSAFVQKIYEIFDVALPRTALEQARVGKRVDREDLQEGDLVFFHDNHTAGYVGIYIGGNKFVHASPSGNREVQIGHLNAPNVGKYFIRAVRIKDLDDV